MRVLEINKFFPPHIGGIERVVKDIAVGVSKYVDVAVLVCASEKSVDIRAEGSYALVEAPTLWVWLSMPVSLKFPLYLCKMTKGADVLHFHLPFPLGVISYLLLCKKKKHKVVVSWYSDIVRQKLFLAVYRWFLLLLLKKADVVIVPAPSVINSSSFLPRFREKCVVVPIGIDVNRFLISDGERPIVDSIREKYGERIVLFVGRLVYYKGVDVLIRAMQQIDATLLIIGDGPLKEQYKRLADSLGIRDRIHFLSDVKDDRLVYFYHACDVFVLPSVEKSEAYGIVQLEAMACGKPVVSTDLPTGVTFINKNGVTGVVVPVGDVSALAEAVSMLLENPELRRVYGENGRKRVREEFSVDVMNRRILEVYEKVYKEN